MINSIYNKEDIPQSIFNIENEKENISYHIYCYPKYEAEKE